MLAGIPRAFGIYVDQLFAELHRDQRSPVFSCSSGRVSGCYSRIVHFTSSQTEYLFSLCCCQTTEANPAHLFWGAYVIDALEEEVGRVLSERGADFLIHSDTPLFDGASSERAVGYLCKLAEQNLEEDLSHSHGILFDVIDCLSLMDYEQEKAKGDLVFLPNMPEDLERLCVWSVPKQDRVECSMKQLRTLRKFLAGTASDAPGGISVALLFVKEGEQPTFCGAVRLEHGLPLLDSKLGYVQVRVSGPLRWELLLFGKLACRRDAVGLCFPDGLDHSGTEKEVKKRIQRALRAAFTQKDSANAVEENLNHLTEIVQSVQKQHHGAAVVLADWGKRAKCRTTLQRLKEHKKAIPVTFAGSGDQLVAVTCAAKMDGAILVDIRNGQIVALATILDGESCVEGDTSRGSRYNSIANATRLLRVSAERSEVVSFVFSSDGGMDILF